MAYIDIGLTMAFIDLCDQQCGTKYQSYRNAGNGKSWDPWERALLTGQSKLMSEEIKMFHSHTTSDTTSPILNPEKQKWPTSWSIEAWSSSSYLASLPHTVRKTCCGYPTWFTALTRTVVFSGWRPLKRVLYPQIQTYTSSSLQLTPAEESATPAWLWIPYPSSVPSLTSAWCSSFCWSTSIHSSARWIRSSSFRLGSTSSRSVSASISVTAPTLIASDIVPCSPILMFLNCMWRYDFWPNLFIGITKDTLQAWWINSS